MLIDTKAQKLLDTDVDMAALARRLDILRPWERIGDLVPPLQAKSAKAARAPKRPARKSPEAEAQAS